MTFAAGGGTLGSATLDGSGRAALATSTLGVGSHSITAAYPGDALCSSSESAAVEVTVNPVPNVDTTGALGRSRVGPDRRGLHAHRHSVPGVGHGIRHLHRRWCGARKRRPVGGAATLEVSGEDVAGAVLAASYGGTTGYGAADASGITVDIDEVAVTLGAGTAEPGGEVQIDGSGFAPGGTVQLWLHSDPVLLGEVVADGQGRFSVVLTLPEGIAGEHAIYAVGESASGQPIEAIARLAIDEEFIPPEELPLTGGGLSPLILLAFLMMIGGR